MEHPVEISRFKTEKTNWVHPSQLGPLHSGFEAGGPWTQGQPSLQTVFGMPQFLWLFGLVFGLFGFFGLFFFFFNLENFLISSKYLVFIHLSNYCKVCHAEASTHSVMLFTKAGRRRDWSKCLRVKWLEHPLITTGTVGSDKRSPLDHSLDVHAMVHRWRSSGPNCKERVRTL